MFLNAASLPITISRFFRRLLGLFEPAHVRVEIGRANSNRPCAARQREVEHESDHLAAAVHSSPGTAHSAIQGRSPGLAGNTLADVCVYIARANIKPGRWTEAGLSGESNDPIGHA